MRIAALGVGRLARFDHKQKMTVAGVITPCWHLHSLPPPRFAFLQDSHHYSCSPGLQGKNLRSFTTSNFSIAFPYVSVDEHETLESSLVKGFAENYGQGLGVDRVAYLDSCSVYGRNLEKL
ncbi:hypothetical protein Cni_G22416 [Canna indica]|uniref:Uncharacterized protein n=1 Tax=Canna indica TaxID=4628 RepID=A0AAQ3KV31_9LILI|nr:hypothetical protein Cni_G22416 [Canna indica]